MISNRASGRQSGWALRREAQSARVVLLGLSHAAFSRRPPQARGARDVCYALRGAGVSHAKVEARARRRATAPVSPLASAPLWRSASRSLRLSSPVPCSTAQRSHPPLEPFSASPESAPNPLATRPHPHPLTRHPPPPHSQEMQAVQANLYRQASIYDSARSANSLRLLRLKARRARRRERKRERGNGSAASARLPGRRQPGHALSAAHARQTPLTVPTPALPSPPPYTHRTTSPPARRRPGSSPRRPSPGVS